MYMDVKLWVLSQTAGSTFEDPDVESHVIADTYK